MCTKIINDQLTDLFYNFIEMEDRIAANDRYADLKDSIVCGIVGLICIVFIVKRTIDFLKNKKS